MPPPRPSPNAIWQGVGAQLRHPSGFLGRVAGAVMTFVNARPNALAVAALDLTEGGVLLELGCGPGRALNGLLRLPHLSRAIGLDWSEVMLAEAARRNRRTIEAGRLALVRGDFANLPFVDDIADAILAVNVVYFMSGSAAGGEAHRVLRPGGRLVLYATHGSTMRRWPFASRHSHRLFDQKRLTALLVEAGFARDCIRIEAVDAGFGVRGLLAVARKGERAEASSRVLRRGG